MSSQSSDRHRFHLPAVALLAMSIGASLLAAPPAYADHDHGPSFHFSFGFPPPPPPPAIYAPPPVYYSPAPRIVIQHRPYYRDWHYRERHHHRHGHGDRHHWRRGHPHRDYDDHDH